MDNPARPDNSLIRFISWQLPSVSGVAIIASADSCAGAGPKESFNWNILAE
jgi:hypothetical protein